MNTARTTMTGNHENVNHELSDEVLRGVSGGGRLRNIVRAARGICKVVKLVKAIKEHRDEE